MPRKNQRTKKIVTSREEKKFKHDLVGGIPTPLKHMSSSVGIFWNSQLNGKNMFQSPPTRWSTEMIMVEFQHQCAMLIFSWPLEGLILWRKSGPLPKYMMFLLMGMVPIVYKTTMGNMINMFFLIYNYNNDIFRKQTIISQYQTQSQHTRRRKFWKIIFTNHLPTVSNSDPMHQAFSWSSPNDWILIAVDQLITWKIIKSTMIHLLLSYRWPTLDRLPSGKFIMGKSTINGNFQ